MVSLWGMNFTAEDFKKSLILTGGFAGLTGLFYYGYTKYGIESSEGTPNKSVSFKGKPRLVIEQPTPTKSRLDSTDTAEELFDPNSPSRLARIKSQRNQQVVILHAAKQDGSMGGLKEPTSPYSKEVKSTILTKNESKRVENVAKYYLLNNYNRVEDKNKVYLFCITGGPRAGKTTCLQWLSERFTPRFKVYVLPEMRDLTASAGMTNNCGEGQTMNDDTAVSVTKSMMKIQMNLEDYFIETARDEDTDVIIFTDRGMLDNFAYVNENVQKRVLEETGWTLDKLTNHRYHAVCHLVTAADGAEKFYPILEQQDDKRIALADAIRLDKEFQKVWMPSNHRFIVGNDHEGFNQKLEQMYKHITEYLGIPGEVHFVKKFLVDGGFKEEGLPPNTPSSTFREEFDYLEEEDKNRLVWVKKRTDPYGNISWSHVVRHMALKNSERMELKKKIDEDMYKSYLGQKDANKKTISKSFTVFVWNNNTYMVESMFINGKSVTILRVNTDSLDSTSEIQNLPEFMKIVKDISEDESYMTSKICEKY
jgi:predicted ATPase